MPVTACLLGSRSLAAPVCASLHAAVSAMTLSQGSDSSVRCPADTWHDVPSAPQPSWCQPRCAEPSTQQQCQPSAFPSPPEAPRRRLALPAGHGAPRCRGQPALCRPAGCPPPAAGARRAVTQGVCGTLAAAWAPCVWQAPHVQEAPATRAAMRCTPSCTGSRPSVAHASSCLVQCCHDSGCPPDLTRCPSIRPALIQQHQGTIIGTPASGGKC